MAATSIDVYYKVHKWLGEKYVTFYKVYTCFKVPCHIFFLSPNFETFKEPGNRFQGISSASICSLAGRYKNPIPTRFLAP